MKTIAAYELLCLAILAPLLLFPTRWTPLALAVIAVLWLCRWRATGRLGVGAAVDAPLVGLLLMAGVGVWVSLDRAASLPALWRLLLGVALFYGLATALSTERRRRWLPAALIVGSLALTLLTLLGTGWDRVRLLNLPQLYSRLPGWLRDVQDQNPFNPRVMGLALSTWLPLPLAQLVFSRTRRYRLWAGIAVVAMALTIVLTQSLQAVVGVGCAVLFLGICWSRWFLLSVPLLVAAGLLALWSYGPQRAAAAALAVSDPLGIAASLRLDMWSRACAMIGDMPYTGIGLDTFPLMQWHFYPGVMLGREPHAHNLFLQVALDLGLPGLLAFLWLLLVVAWRAARALRRGADAERRAVLLGVLAALASCLAAGLLDTMWASKAAVVLWIVLGVGVGLSMDGKRTEGSDPRELASPLGLDNGGFCPFIRLATGHPLTVSLLLLLLLIPGLLLPRQAWALNERLIRAHRVVLAAASGQNVARQELLAVRDNLRWLAQGGVERASLYSLLGQAEAWLGQGEAALAALERRVELDGRHPLASYAPFEALRRWVAREERRDPWEDLAWIYGHWVGRFPQRAEPYVLLALVRARQGSDKVAVQVLQSGLPKGAQPLALLDYAVEHSDTFGLRAAEEP